MLRINGHSCSDGLILFRGYVSFAGGARCSSKSGRTVSVGSTVDHSPDGDAIVYLSKDSSRTRISIGRHCLRWDYLIAETCPRCSFWKSSAPTLWECLFNDHKCPRPPAIPLDHDSGQAFQPANPSVSVRTHEDPPVVWSIPPRYLARLG